MDKQFQAVKDFVTDPKNRKTIIAVGAGLAVAAVVTMFTTRGGKAKR